MKKLDNTYKILILFVLFLNSNFFFLKAQSLENISKIDTVYVFFDHNRYQEIDKTNWTSSDPNNHMFDNRKNYIFSQDENNSISFVYNDYLDFDNYHKNLKTDVQKVNKKFLLKNKDKIINIDFFLKNGFRETFFTIYKKKVYLIDSEEIKCRKLTLREVVVRSHNYFTE